MVEPISAASEDLVELFGYLGKAPGGRYRLFEKSTRFGRYVEIKVRDAVHRFADPELKDVTVIAVSRKAEVAMCTRLSLSGSVALRGRRWPRR